MDEDGGKIFPSFQFCCSRCWSRGVARKKAYEFTGREAAVRAPLWGVGGVGWGGLGSSSRLDGCDRSITECVPDSLFDCLSSSSLLQFGPAFMIHVLITLFLKQNWKQFLQPHWDPGWPPRSPAFFVESGPFVLFGAPEKTCFSHLRSCQPLRSRAGGEHRSTSTSHRGRERRGPMCVQSHV